MVSSEIPHQNVENNKKIATIFNMYTDYEIEGMDWFLAVLESLIFGQIFSTRVP